MDLGSLTSTLFVCLLVAAAFMSCMFAIGHRMQRYDIVDVAWGLVFNVITIAALLQQPTIRVVDVIVLLLVAIWGFRLSSHIYRRLRATPTEDKRYVELRKKWRSNNQAFAVFLRIYMIQALLATIVSLPVVVILNADARVTPLFVVIGLIIWIFGFIIEATADRQLREFIRNAANKGQLMTRGLWRYTRHPNYFGELTMWWSVGIIALGVPYGWIGLVGPMLISHLIIFVSGIPPTEKAFAGRPGWSVYKRRTSVLIPWFVKKEVTK